MRACFLVSILIGCGSSGDPIKGDVAINYGGDSPDLKVGSVVEDQNDPTKMVVQVGTQDVDCSTYLDVFISFNLPSGTFLYFNVDKVPGAYPTASVSAMHNSSNNIKINSGTGMVTIDTIAPRVTGGVTFDTNDQDVGAITASGSFDVVRCF